jgi:hypothetical protein
MVTGVGGIGEATAVLHAVAQDQHATVERLTGRVGETRERINAMSALAERLERRDAERIATSGPVRFGVDGGSDFVTGQLMDLSTGGLRCEVDGEVPLRSGDTVVVELDLGGAPLRPHAQVMHCVRQGAQTEVGLQFLKPADDVVAAIRNFADSSA